MLAEKESPDYWAVCMTFAEQRVLGMYAEARSIYARLLFDIDKGSIIHLRCAAIALSPWRSARCFQPMKRPRKAMRRLADSPRHPFIKRMYEKTIRYYYPEAKEKPSTGGTV